MARTTFGLPLLLAALPLGCAAADATFKRLDLPGLSLVVRLPAGHAAGVPARQLWVLDGESTLAVAAEAVRLVALECGTPEPVLVAVGDGHAIGTPGNRRGRDYTPVASAQPWARGDGGAAGFLARLRDEALPWVAREVGPAGERALYGHSYGGLFAAYAWLQAPGLFQRWMLASPSLFYADGWAPRQLAAPPPPDRAPGGAMLLSAGSEEDWAVQGNAGWAAALAAWPAPVRPALTQVTLEGFGHLSGSPVSVMRAVRWAYCKP